MQNTNIKQQHECINSMYHADQMNYVDYMRYEDKPQEKQCRLVRITVSSMEQIGETPSYSTSPQTLANMRYVQEFPIQEDKLYKEADLGKETSSPVCMNLVGNGPSQTSGLESLASNTQAPKKCRSIQRHRQKERVHNKYIHRRSIFH